MGMTDSECQKGLSVLSGTLFILKLYTTHKGLDHTQQVLRLRYTQLRVGIKTTDTILQYNPRVRPITNILTLH